MHSVRLSVIVCFILYAVAILTVPAMAQAELNCTFNSQLDAAGFSYNVAATSDDSCKSQLLRISVHKEGHPFTQLITPFTRLVEKAWIVDLDDDNRYELIIISHDATDDSKKSMDLYALDGGALKQVMFPDPRDMSGYRGGDSFQWDGVRLNRVFPVYLPQDVTGTPTGGERRIVYQYRNRELLLSSVSEAAKPVASVKKDAKRTVVAPDKKRAVVKLTGIKSKTDYIEIQANGPIENYKVIRIDEPWRLIVDISGVVPGFESKTVAINSHGISTARIGAHKGYTRIVFDATVSPLPTETVTPAENALRIGFYVTTPK